jgi:hypothetical protein
MRERDPWWLMNPNADDPCGAKDPEAIVPERVHYDCKECRRIVRELLESRVQPPPERTESEQGTLFELHRPREHRVRRGRRET